jgi:SpoVK/Ycf46/Vps4 family AAA+-type ATPase
LERVLWIAENLSPCILWTDELDQAIGGQRNTGQSADGGTSERMLARLFEYFGAMNKRGRILWIGTTNRPDVLDPALLDRFQVILPWIHPTPRERAALLPLLAKQVERELDASIDVEVLARHASLEMLTVRSLQEIVVAAAMLADLRTGQTGATVSFTDVMGALADYKAAQSTTEHEFLALKAVQMASFTSLLPWVGDDGEVADDLPPYLADLIDPCTGRIDDRQLAARIDERERQRTEGRWRR